MTTNVLVGGYNPDEIYSKKQEQVRKERDLEAIAQEAQRREDEVRRRGAADSGSPAEANTPGVSPSTTSLSKLPTVRAYANHVSISDVIIEGHRIDLEMGTNFLDNGLTHDRDGWTAYNNQPATRFGGFNSRYKVFSAPVYFAIFDALYQRKDHRDSETRDGVEKARAVLARWFNTPTMFMTMSEVQYRVAGVTGAFDRVEHPTRGVRTKSHDGIVIAGREDFMVNLPPHEGEKISRCLLGIPYERAQGLREWLHPSGNLLPSVLEMDIYLSRRPYFEPTLQVDPVRTPICFGTKHSPDGTGKHCFRLEASNPEASYPAIGARIIRSTKVKTP